MVISVSIAERCEGANKTEIAYVDLLEDAAL